MTALRWRSASVSARWSLPGRILCRCVRIQPRVISSRQNLSDEQQPAPVVTHHASDGHRAHTVRLEREVASCSSVVTIFSLCNSST